MRERHPEMAAKQASEKAKSPGVFGQSRRPTKMFRAGLYARVSTSDQQTLPLQIRALREYAARRGWTIALQVKEVGSGASQRQLRERLAGGGAPPRNRRGAGVAFGPLGPVRGGPVGHSPGTGAPRRRFRFPERSPGPDDTSRAGHGSRYWPFSRPSNGRSCRNECAPAWPTLGRTASAWAGRLQRPCTLLTSGNYIALASPKLRSPASSGSGALQYAESWAIPPRIGQPAFLYAGLPKAYVLA
jgi:hypothetical protein